MMKILFTFYFLLFNLGLSLSAYAAETGTVSSANNVNFTPWRVNPSVMTSIKDPHPDTSFPQTMSETQVDTQRGRGLPTGFNQAGLIDATTTSSVGDFQFVVNRINSVQTPTGRLSQLQTEIKQNQSQAGYIFDNKLGVTSTNSANGNFQASGNFIQTRQEALPGGGTVTTTCVGTFTAVSVSDPVTGQPLLDSQGRVLVDHTITSGTATGQGTGCTTQ